MLGGQTLASEGGLALLGRYGTSFVRVSTQMDITTNTVLADIPGLSVLLAAGLTYSFRAVLHVGTASSSGIKAALSGSCTATALRASVFVYQTGGLVVIQVPITALDSSTGSTTTVGAVIYEGSIIVNAAGTFTIQAAQNVSSGTSSIYVGSTLQVTQLS